MIEAVVSETAKEFPRGKWLPNMDMEIIFWTDSNLCNEDLTRIRYLEGVVFNSQCQYRIISHEFCGISMTNCISASCICAEIKYFLAAKSLQKKQEFNCARQL